MRRFDALRTFFYNRANRSDGCCSTLAHCARFLKSGTGFAAFFILVAKGIWAPRDDLAADKYMLLFRNDITGSCRDVAELNCPSAVIIANLMHAEDNLFSLLPAASNAVHWTTWRSKVLYVWQLVQEALGLQQVSQADSGPKIPCCTAGSLVPALLQAAWRRVRRLLRLVSRAFGEPWVRPGAPLRAWLRDGGVIRTFQRLGRPAGVPVGSSSVSLLFDMDALQLATHSQERGGLGGSATVQREAWEDVRPVLQSLRHRLARRSVRLRAGRRWLRGLADGLWWPVKGTLLALLRHGAWRGNLSAGKVDIVDKDMDIAVLIQSPELWFFAVALITRELVKKGWLGCYHENTNWYNPASSEYPSGDVTGAKVAWSAGRKTLGPGADVPLVDGRGPSLLKCFRQFPRAEGPLGEGGGWAALEIIWFRALRRSSLAGGGAGSRAAAVGTTSTGLSGAGVGADPSPERGCDSTALGPAVVSSPLRSGLGKPLLRFHPLQSLVLDANPLCEVGRAGRGRARCYASRSYPQQCWSEGLPAAHVLPLAARCRAYGAAAPCPAAPRELLRWYNDGELWARLPGRPCLALPIVVKVAQLGRTADRQPNDPHNQRLMKEGITRADARVLMRRARQLREMGFEAFGPADFAECSPPSGAQGAVVTVGYMPS